MQGGFSVGTGINEQASVQNNLQQRRRERRAKWHAVSLCQEESSGYLIRQYSLVDGRRHPRPFGAEELLDMANVTGRI